MRFGLGPVLVLLSITGAALPTAAHSQTPHLEMDLTASQIEYDTLAALNAPSLSLLSQWQRRSWFGRVATSVTGFEDAGWSVQGRGDLAGWLTPGGVSSPLRIELGGSAAGSHHSQGFDSSLGRIDGRMHLVGRRVGGWLGASVAAAKNSLDSTAVTAFVPGGGVWVQNGRIRGMISYLHMSAAGEAYPEADATLTLSSGQLDLTLYGGVRDWPFDPGRLDERWAGATAAYWVTSRAAIVVSGGKYSSDVLRGLPGGQFVSVGLRLTPRRVRPIPIRAVAPIVYTTEDASAGDIGFEVNGAARVEIAGDWTGWQRVELTRSASGRWTLPTGLEPGGYRFNLLVDGERWMVPEGVPTIDDGFGGVVGLLIISSPS